METFDLQFAELDVEIVNEVFEDVARLSHQLGRLLVSQDLLQVFVRFFEVSEEQNEHFLLVSRYFH